MFIFPAKSANADDAWNGDIATSFKDGDGSQDNPYQISNGAELAFLAQEVNASKYTDAYFRLTADINLGSKEWTSIGSESAPFTGKFDGNSKTISNLNSNVGLFGYNSGTIKNVYLDSVNINTDRTNAAALCAVNNSGATIEGCGVLGGSIIGSNLRGSNVAAGICSKNNGKISRCYNLADVTVNQNGAGIAANNYGTVSNCYNAGTISGENWVGGICYYNYSGTIEYCLNFGKINGASSAGISAFIYNATITRSYTDVNCSKKVYSGAEGDNVCTGETKTPEELCNGRLPYDFESGVWAIGSFNESTTSNSKLKEVKYTYPSLRGVTKAASTTTGYKYNFGTDTDDWQTATLITNADGLAAINNDLSGNYVLDRDIDLGGKDWTPIGSESSPFTGLFSGDGKTVSNFKSSISQTGGSAGLFGYNSGTIQKVYVNNFEVKTNGKSPAAGLCAINNNGATIEDCATLGGSVNVSSNYGGAVAGICSLNYGTVNRCYNMATVKTGVDGAGVVNANQSSGTVSNCYNAGEVSAIENSYGIVGGISSTNFGTIEFCLNYGKIENANSIGGICASNSSTIESCFSDSDVCSVGAVGSSLGSTTAVETKTTEELCGYDFLNEVNFGSEWEPGFYEGRNASSTPNRLGVISIKYPSLKDVSKDATSKVYNAYDFGIDSNNKDWQKYTLITTADELAAINNDLGGNYVLGGDIDLGGKVWTPIGSTSGAFSGKFSGNGYTISGIKVSVTGQYESAGLFGYSTGVIMNVAVEGDIIGTNAVGGICGANSAADGGIIYACSFNGTVTGTGNYVGGICGYIYPGFINAKISNCFSAADVTGSNEVGGICGYNGDGATVSDTISVGTVSGTGNLVAAVCGKNDGTLTDNYFDTDVCSLVGAKDNTGAEFASGTTGWTTAVLCADNALTTLNLDNSIWKVGGIKTTADPTNPRMRTANTVYPSLIGVGEPFSLGEEKQYNFKTTGDDDDWQPYTEINSAADLENIRNNPDGNYVLMTDIKLGNFTPIGNKGSFSGKFSGNGHTISGVKINGGTRGGLFDWNKGLIMNLAVEGDVTGGNAGGICEYNYGTIYACSFKGSVKGKTYVGGISGYNEGTISNCYAMGTVEATDSNAGYAGGICGYKEKGTIECCYFAGIPMSAGDHNREICYGGSQYCYYDRELYYVSDSGLGALSTEKLCDSLPSGFSSDIWEKGSFTVTSTGGKFRTVSYKYPRLKEGCEAYKVDDVKQYNFKTDDKDYWARFKEIKTLADLNNVNNNTNANYVLMNDIDLKGAAFTPISNVYYGKFSGDGHTIKNGKIVGGDFTGLFSRNVGLIMNLSVKCDVSGSNVVGGICGYNDGIVYGCSFEGSVTGSKYVGGICGSMTSGEGKHIINCYVIGTIEAAAEAGGISGSSSGDYDPGQHAVYDYPSIKNCYFVGTVTVPENAQKDAITTKTSEAKYQLTVENCYYNSDIYTGSTTYGTAKTTKELCSLQPSDAFESGDYSDTPDANNSRMRTVSGKYPRLIEGCAAYELDAVKEYNFSTDDYGYWQSYTEINSAEEFIALGNDSSKWSGNYVLTQDIDLSGKNVKPIGDWVTGAFTGNFSGDGYTISGVEINGGDNVGLFGAFDGGGCTIMNLAVEGNITGDYYVGGICGSINAGNKIFACTFAGSVSGEKCVGGICGYNDRGTISDCFNSGTIEGTDYAGGVCGYRTSGYVQNCINVSKVSSKNPIVGGEGNGFGNCNNNYYDSTVLGGTAGNNIGTAKTTEELCADDALTTLNLDDSIWKAGGIKTTADPTNQRMRTANTVYPSLKGVGEPLSLGEEKQYNFKTDGNDDWQEYTEIKTAADLAKIQQNPAGNYVLMNDINLGSFTPIDSFSGKFSGNGHTISNLKINGEDDFVGLFGENDGGLIMNLAVKGDIVGKDNVGGICGSNGGTIYACSFEGSVNGNKYVGGICGYSRSTGTVSNCYAIGSVKATGEYAGGISGASFSDNSDSTTWAKIENCYYSGSVTGASTSRGAISGDSHSFTIKNCYYNSDLSYDEHGTPLTTVEFCGNLPSGFSSEVWESGSINITTDPENSRMRTVSGKYPRLKEGCAAYELDAVKQYNFSFDGGEDWQEYTEIKTAAEFIALGNDKSKWYDNFVLLNDIDLKGKKVTPIGTTKISEEFNGNFSGDGHTISNVSISGERGLFDCNKGTIMNLAVTGDIQGDGDGVGSICGSNNGTIYGCSFEGSVKSGKMAVGGICGYNNSNISNCFVIATVESTYYETNDWQGYPGGIVGMNSSKNSTISNCYFVGTVTAKANGTHGAICNSFTGYGTVTNCYYNSDLYTEADSKGTGLSTIEMSSSDALTKMGLDTSIWEKKANTAVDSKGQNGVAYYPSLIGSTYSKSVKYTAELTFERIEDTPVTYLELPEYKYSCTIKFANGAEKQLNNTELKYTVSDSTGNITNKLLSGFNERLTAYAVGKITYTLKCEPKTNGLLPDSGLTKTLVVNVDKMNLSEGCFNFTKPSDLTYNGNQKQASVSIDSQITGYGKITVKYFDSDGNEVKPINAGEYTVKIDVTEGTNCKAVKGLTADSWKFTIAKAQSSTTYYEFSVSSGTTTYTLSVVELPDDLGKINKFEMTHQSGNDGVITAAERKGKNIIFTLDGSKGAYNEETVKICIDSQNYSPFVLDVTVNVNDKGTQNAPKCEVTLTHDGNGADSYTATITAVDGAEYRFDGKTWSGSNTLTGIKHGAKVNASIRMKETADKNASENVTKTLTADTDLKWKSDKDGHWQACSKCDYEETSHGAHTFDGNTCTICGYKKSGGSTGGGSSSGGSTGGGSSSGGGSSRPRNPAVNGKEMTWNDVTNEINKLTEGGEATIDLNGNTTVPKDVIKAIADKKALITIKVNGTFSWTIDGSKLTESDITDMDFKVSVMTASGTEVLRGTVGTGFKIENVTDKAVLNITFKAAHSGKFANLYKKADGKLEFVDNVKIDENGNAIGLEVHEKGEYAVMLGELSDRPGDMDNDGILNAKDALAVLKDFARLITGKNPLVCDLNGDGYVNANDALIILKMAAGLIKM